MNTRSPLLVRGYLMLALTALATSCSPPKPDPSLQAFEGLLFSLRSGNLDQLWSKLSAESRSWLFTEVGLSPLQELLEHDTPPESLKRVLSLQPSWRFESRWGERVQRDPQAPSDEEGAWFMFSEHGRQWRVHGLRRADGWRFDLFHATPSPHPEAGSR